MWTVLLCMLGHPHVSPMSHIAYVYGLSQHASMLSHVFNTYVSVSNWYAQSPHMFLLSNAPFVGCSSEHILMPSFIGGIQCLLCKLFMSTLLVTLMGLRASCVSCVWDPYIGNSSQHGCHCTSHTFDTLYVDDSNLYVPLCISYV